MYIIMWNHNICFHGHSPTPKKSTPRSGALRPTAHCAGELAVLRVEGRSSGGVWGGVLTQWIGLRENLQESPMIFMGKSMVSCNISLKPIQYGNMWEHCGKYNTSQKWQLEWSKWWLTIRLWMSVVADTQQQENEEEEEWLTWKDNRILFSRQKPCRLRQ